jgi:transposase
LSPELDDEQLEQLLYPSEIKLNRATPDWVLIHQEMKKKGVVLSVLWDEYRSNESHGIGYSRFCDLYRQFKKTLDPVMRQTHKAGEKLFVDYAGMTMPWIDRQTGEVCKAEIFVAVLGASNYTFVEASATQSLPDWIASHVHAFQFLGGVPEIVVPDNLKSGVTKAHRYDPDINLTYQDMANHYGVAIIPARAASPKDKSKVEVGVQGIERQILARLRHHTFFSITQLNTAIRLLLIEYNQKPFQKMPGCRLSDFISIDQPALKSLPVHTYEYAEWKKARAGIDYHVSFDHHYYSVPHHYIQYELDLRMTQKLVQCFYKSKLIAVHIRCYKKGHTTLKEHMPRSHQEYAQWTPERIMSWAKQSGEKTHELIHAMIAARPHPQQAFRACLGVMRLGKNYGNDRLEKAAQRALSLGAISYKSIESILKHGLDQKPVLSIQDSISEPISHDNLRGSDYYH